MEQVNAEPSGSKTAEKAATEVATEKTKKSSNSKVLREILEVLRGQNRHLDTQNSWLRQLVELKAAELYGEAELDPADEWQAEEVRGELPALTKERAKYGDGEIEEEELEVSEDEEEEEKEKEKEDDEGSEEESEAEAEVEIVEK